MPTNDQQMASFTPILHTDTISSVLQGTRRASTNLEQMKACIPEDGRRRFPDRWQMLVSLGVMYGLWMRLLQTERTDDLVGNTFGDFVHKLNAFQYAMLVDMIPDCHCVTRLEELICYLQRRL